jgi:hypothetical protein
MRLLEEEIACRNEQGVMLVQQAVGPSLQLYLQSREKALREDLDRFYLEAYGGPPSEEQIQQVLMEIQNRFELALEGHLTAQPVFSTLDTGHLAEAAAEDSGQWAAPLSLLYHGARLFRGAAAGTAFDRGFKFNSFDRQVFLPAMDVFGDVMAAAPQPGRAAAELQKLESILGDSSAPREKCLAIWRLVKGTV